MKEIQNKEVLHKSIQKNKLSKSTLITVTKEGDMIMKPDPQKKSCCMKFNLFFKDTEGMLNL